MAGTVVADTLQSSITGTPVQFNDGAGTQIGTLCRAWVNFNGVTTATIRASFNVSSVTRNGTGDYTVNLTTALTDANYAPVITGLSASATDGRAAYFVRGTRSTGTASTQTTTALEVSSYDPQTAGWPVIDAGYVTVAIFR